MFVVYCDVVVVGVEYYEYVVGVEVFGDCVGDLFFEVFLYLWLCCEYFDYVYEGI